MDLSQVDQVYEQFHSTMLHLPRSCQAKPVGEACTLWQIGMVNGRVEPDGTSEVEHRFSVNATARPPCRNGSGQYNSTVQFLRVVAVFYVMPAVFFLYP